MEFCVQPLRRELDAKSESKLHIFYASAQSQFSFSVRSTLIVALRQPVELVLGQQRLRIPRFGAYWVDAEHAGLAQAQAQAAGPWLLLRCNQALWRGMQARLRATEQSKLQPVGGLWPEGRSLSRWALSLVRRVRKTGSSTLSETDFATLTFALQQALTGFGPKIACCPGRTQVQKAQVFRRLMRVRQYIDLHCTENLGIDALADLANYSRAHFMTVFRTVFGETPHAQLLERRLNCARDMLGERGLSVSETTLAVGFEDRSSFSKLFRRRFGVTAKTMRQHGLLDPRAALAARSTSTRARQSGIVQRR